MNCDIQNVNKQIALSTDAFCEWDILKHTTSHNQPQPAITSQNKAQPATTSYNQPKPAWLWLVVCFSVSLL